MRLLTFVIGSLDLEPRKVMDTGDEAFESTACNISELVELGSSVVDRPDRTAIGSGAEVQEKSGIKFKAGEARGRPSNMSDLLAFVGAWVDEDWKRV